MQIEVKELDGEGHEHCEFTGEAYGELIESSEKLCPQVAVNEVFMDDNPETGTFGKFCQNHGSRIAAATILEGD